MNQQLLDFIKRQIEGGKSREEITRILISQGGWTETEVKDAFASFAAPVSTVAAQSLPSSPTPALSTSAPSGVGTPTSSPMNVGAVTPPPTMGVYKQSRPPRGLRVTTTIALVVLFLLLAAGAAWAFFIYFPDLIKPKPEEALAKSLQALVAAPTIHIDGSLNAVGTFESENQITRATSTATSTLAKFSSTTPEILKGDYVIKLGFESTVDRRTAGSPKVTLSLSPDVSVKIPPLTFDLSAVLDTRSIDRTIYVQLRSMTDLLFPIDLSRLKGVWIRLEPSDYTQYTTLPDNQQAEILKKVSDSGVLTVTQEFPTVKEGGVRYRHYAFTLDHAKLASLLAQLNSIPGAATTTASLSKLESPTGEIWISASDYFPHKLTLTYKLDGAQADLSSGNTKLSGTVTFEANLSRAIEEGATVAPNDARSFSDIMGLLESAPQASSTASGTPAVR